MTEAPNSALSVKSIDHLTLVVKDLERCRHFYEDFLEMKSRERPAFSFPGLWFQAGATQIHVTLESDEAGPAGPTGFQGGLPARGFHFAFEVESCDEAAKKLTELGIEIVAGPQSRPDGPRQLYIYDPDGYLVELFSKG
jgi:catechol 2,3-dioxygenase-like lactoylglutathione lyase family enzyme